MEGRKTFQGLLNLEIIIWCEALDLMITMLIQEDVLLLIIDILLLITITEIIHLRIHIMTRLTIGNAKIIIMNGIRKLDHILGQVITKEADPESISDNT
jgi:hypothetical protein